MLALENPGLPGQRLATDALYAGLQLILPGEIAPSHRHSAAALRLIIEGRGAYTAVSGERAYMEPGDFIVTPSWTWHEHGNEGDGATIWLDVLDVALVRFLGAGFSEHYPGGRFLDRMPPGDSRYRFGANMRPAGYTREPGASPVFSYPYAQAREVLERLRRSAALDPCHGLKMEYIDPTTGSPAIPTLSTFLQLVPGGMRTSRYRNTAGAVYAVVEGRGRAIVGTDEHLVELPFAARDLFAVPVWQPLALEADEDVVVFSASGEAAQRLLGIWREQRGE
jgi:gentisate 1,2-dioxygenase